MELKAVVHGAHSYEKVTCKRERIKCDASPLGGRARKEELNTFLRMKMDVHAGEARIKPINSPKRYSQEL